LKLGSRSPNPLSVNTWSGHGFDDFAPDGQQFLIPRPEHPESANGSATTPITVIVNWAATLKK
jgi:hypothetical protein